MDGLSLSLFGAPTIHVDGAPLQVDTRKAVALLAYLAVEGSQTRESLAALLWAQSDESRARAALRRTLSVLNRALAGRWLEAERARVALGGDWLCDVTAFRRSLGRTRDHGHPANGPCPICLDALEKAASLYIGDFLQGFSLRDSEPFDEWMLSTAGNLRRDLAIVLERLVEGLIALGRLDDAIGHARRQVAMDPLDEMAHRQLMKLYAWTGRRGDAVRQYRECAAALERELGVAPLDETAELYQAVVDNRVTPPPAASERPVDPVLRPAPFAPAASTDAPLVGRDADLQRLLSVHDAIDEAGHFVAVTGEAGIGKSRLAAEFVDRLRERGATALSIRCHRGDEHLPYAPIAEALREALTSRAEDHWLNGVPPYWRAEAMRLVPNLGPGTEPPLEPLTSPGAQSRFVEGVWQVLSGALGGPIPGVLLIDDLHRADEATLDMLAYLIARLDSRRLMLMACWREDEFDDERWRNVIDDAVGAGRASLVALQRLSPEHVASLVDALADDPQPDMMARLQDEAEGLPLAVVAYLQVLQDAQRSLPWPLPRGLQRLYRAKVDALDDVARQVVTAAAVIGRSFDLETLVVTAGRSELETVGALEVLTARGLIREVEPVAGNLQFDFIHDKLRAVVYDATSQARRRLLHRRVADTLRTQPRAGEPLTLSGRIAYHERLGGREQEAAEMHVRAANEARRLYANREALEHFRWALALGHPDVGSLREAVGDLETLDGNYRTALASYETAAAAVSDPVAVAALEHKIAQVHVRASDPAAAMSRLDAALVTLADFDSPALRARIHADRSLAAVQIGSAALAESEGRRALAVAERAGDRPALAQVRNLLGLLARRAGRYGDAEQQFQIAADLSADLPSPEARIAALNNLALTLGAAGRVEQALGHLRVAVDLCARIGDRHREAALHNNMADLLHTAGREDEAMHHLKKAVARFADVGGHDERQPEIWQLVDW